MCQTCKPLLLRADERFNDEQIAEALNVGTAAVGCTRKRFVEPGQEALIIALAYGDVREKHARWTLRLLADKVVELGIAESISHKGARKTPEKRTQVLA